MSTGFESQVTQLYIKLFFYQRSYIIVQGVTYLPCFQRINAM